MSDLTHFNEQGRAKMVDVGEKPLSRRTAVAAGRVLVNRETFEKIRTGGTKKGDVLTVAQIAGIMGAKHTPHLIPMCHPIAPDGINLELTLDECRPSVEITATVSTRLPQGNPMERGMVPMAACTVAFGVYAIMQNNRSLPFSGVASRDRKTPAMRNTNAAATSRMTATPAALA